MSEMNYTPNSHKYKAEQATKAAPEEKNIQKVVSGKAKLKKKSELRKFTDVFISEDAKNVKSYVVMDVLVPAIKKAISDIVTDGIDMILFGGRGNRPRGSTASKISYKDFYGRGDSRYSREEPRTRTGYNYDDIILDSRGEAEDVLSRMDELIETYGEVSVADLYDLVGVTGNYTDNKYGWTNIRNAEPVRVRDGYMLKLPKAGPLKY